MSIAIQNFSDAGRTMLGRANNGELLTFDTIVIGAGAAAAPADIYPLTALIDHRFDVAITAQVDQGNGILMLDGVINSVDIPVGQGFNLCELGLMAHIALEAPALYSAANVFATTPDYIPDAVENPTAVHAFKIKVVIDRAPNVTVVLGTSTDILAENMGPAMDPNGVAWPGVFHEKLANTLRFKRLTPGTSIEIIEEPLDPFNITIGLKTLKVDLDLYVPLTHPTGGIPGETIFDTVQEALAYLAPIAIPPERLATIHIEGIALATEPIIVTHPYAANIAIRGEPATVLTATSMTVAGNVVTLTAAAGTFTGITVGSYLGVDASPGNTAAMASGVWPVSAVAGDGSTVSYTAAVPPAGTIDPTATALVFPFKTSLVFPAGLHGITFESGLRLLADLVVKGTAGATTGHGVNSAVGDVPCQQVGSSGWAGTTTSSGFICSRSGYLSLTDCYSSQNGNGVYVAATCNLMRMATNGNSQRGVFVTGGNLTAEFLKACQNVTAGVFLDNSTIIFQGLSAFFNGQGGIVLSASNGSFYGIGSFLNGNGGTYDVHLTIISSLINQGAPPLSYATVTPPAQLTADFCIFRP